MTTTTVSGRAISAGGAAIVLAASLASCSSGSASDGAISNPPTPSSSSSSQLHIVVSESANGTRLRVHLGADVVVILHSTYWQFPQVSASKVLAQAGPASYGASPSGSGVPGSGNGTVSETYRARAVGTAVITASRTSCGEALRCTPAQGNYRITVIVR